MSTLALARAKQISSILHRNWRLRGQSDFSIFERCQLSSQTNTIRDYLSFRRFSDSVIVIPPLGSNSNQLVNASDKPEGHNEKEEEDIKDIEEEVRTQPLTTTSDMIPKEVVAELDRWIVGQSDAKRAVANALRNRWRRHKLTDKLREEIVPKNILMIGPTGVGKTEIARRLAKIQQSPFIKVEATKFTEVGFHGRDVDQIIRDLVDNAIQQTKTILTKKYKERIRNHVSNTILEIFLPNASPPERKKWKEQLESGALDNRRIEYDMPEKPVGQAANSLNNLFGNNLSGNMGMSGVSIVPLDLSSTDLQNPRNALLSALGLAQPSTGSTSEKTKKKRMLISEIRPVVEQKELDRILQPDIIQKKAIESVQQDGIVFIDEIDKICVAHDHYHSGADASSEGVQRDLLPIVEGTIVNTKYGNVDTSKILFVASGAFHTCKPSDLLPELQGRLPIRVELARLSEKDLYRILTEPEANMIKQQVELLKTENIELKFLDEAIKEVAKIAYNLNETVENIGARRLYTVVEKVIEEISFDCEKYQGKEFVVDAVYVRQRLEKLMSKTDLTKFIL